MKTKGNPFSSFIFHLSMSLSSSTPPEAPESLVEPAPRPPSAIALIVDALWRDHLLQVLLVLALVANLALFAYLALRFASLAESLPLHFDSSGYADRIDPKGGIFALPVIGITVFLLNVGLSTLIHRRERAATILLTIGTLCVEILMWIAVINIAGIV